MKKNKFFIPVILTVGLVLGTATSCKKSYLDINENPNDPSDVSIVELLPSAEAAITHVVGNHFQIFGGLWGQYWTQSPASSQYKTIEQYLPGANDFDRPWLILYSDALEDLKNIIVKATSENKPNWIAIAKILQAYTYQELTDNFGDVPFTEAIRAEEGIISPKYDSQELIYDGIIALLEEADGLIDENSDFYPGPEDLLLQGDMFLWREFGNTLKLRVYLRMAYVNPTKAMAGIAALEASGAPFLAEGENVQLNYTSNGGNTHPLYSSIIGLSSVQNLVASATGINYMVNNNDPRVDVLYTPANNGTQVGIAQGDYDVSASTQRSLPSGFTGGDAGDPASASAIVRLMTGYESLFLQSEAVARQWMTGDAQALYVAAITENFVELGLTDVMATTYFSQPAIAFPAGGTMEQQIEAIITQKWAAMNGTSGTEGWTEWRRTGYPTFFVESANSLIGAGRFPNRMLYPFVELTRNGNFPGQKDIFVTVWWDVN